LGQTIADVNEFKIQSANQPIIESHHTKMSTDGDINFIKDVVEPADEEFENAYTNISIDG